MFNKEFFTSVLSCSFSSTASNLRKGKLVFGFARFYNNPTFNQFTMEPPAPAGKWIRFTPGATHGKVNIEKMMRKFQLRWVRSFILQQNFFQEYVLLLFFNNKHKFIQQERKNEWNRKHYTRCCLPPFSCSLLFSLLNPLL